MTDRDPNIVNSSLSRRIELSGKPFSVCIYKIEGTNEWSLEVVDENGTSTVWADPFPTDHEANEAFLKAVEEEGVGAFCEPNVIPFPKR